MNYIQEYDNLSGRTFTLLIKLQRTMARAHFNSLPARPEYITKVLSVLENSEPLRVVDIERKTKLTRTQTLCTLEKLIQDQIVMIINKGGANFYQSSQIGPIGTD